MFILFFLFVTAKIEMMDGHKKRDSKIKNISCHKKRDRKIKNISCHKKRDQENFPVTLSQNPTSFKTCQV